MHSSSRRDRARVAHFYWLAIIFAVMFLPSLLISLPSDCSPRRVARGSIAPSQDVSINDFDVWVQVPSFAWLGPIPLNITIHNRNATTAKTVEVSVTGSFIVDFQRQYTLQPNETRTFNEQVDVEFFTLPGNKFLNIAVRYNALSQNTQKIILIGSTWLVILLLGIFVLGVSAGLLVKYRPATSPSSTPGTSTVPPATTGPGGAFPSYDSDDDTSTMTYVDQSRAPPGQIYCPECKKLIEEGSIFCPECGTRIPRYLRYRPT